MRRRSDWVEPSVRHVPRASSYDEEGELGCGALPEGDSAPTARNNRRISARTRGTRFNEPNRPKGSGS
ncbi:hypothetical protein J7E95_40825 [Streptomyces sp. ISL-14]|nr:hypothetical protein [Streptomyces sp. ISL-14]